MRIPRFKRLLKCAAAFTGLALLGWYALPFAVPLPDSLRTAQEASPALLDRHGRPLHHLTLADSTRAAPVTFEKIPADVIATTLAAEDKRFHDHGGVDLLATARAARDGLLERRVISGASTITQQLVKISSPPARRNAWTKAREALAARRLEMTWSKKEILTAYLNRLDYGNRRTGIAEAARFYFQKPLADLSLAECALLAGLPQAPSRLNPLRHPDRALVRRNTVLRRLCANHPDIEARGELAIAEPITLRPLRETLPAPWLPAIAGESSTRRTTLDLDLQNAVEAIVRQETTRLKDANLRHAAAVVIHNPTGEILALVSSADWHDGRGGQINGALAPRSPGSALKPFTYLLAMERLGHTPATIIDDIPAPFRTPQGLKLPENYDRTYRGPVTLRAALACSLNVPALAELDALGGPAPLHELLTRLGISTLGEDPAQHGLGLTIGNAPVRLLDLTNAYATLARHGRHLPPVLFLPVTSQEKSAPHFSTRSAHLIADILADGNARAPSFPPGGPLDLPFRCAVKTGTSSDFRDNWCIGYTPEFTVGVWAGNFEHQPMKGISGVDGAGPVFNRTMRLLHEKQAPTWFETPAGLAEITIDTRNGKTLPAPAKASPWSLRELVPNDRIPPLAGAGDYDSTGKALLAERHASWFTSPHNRRRGEFSLPLSGPAHEPLRVITPATGATFLLDPEIPSGSDKLRPVTNLPGTAKWASPTLRIEPAKPEPIIHLVPGTHTLTATDPRTGDVHQLTLHVKSL